MLLRVMIALVVVGGILAFFGFQEYRVSHGSSAEPVSVDLAEIENGEAIPDNHIRIGEHYAIYDGLIYEYSESSYSTGEPSQDTSVTHSYYPVVSSGHSYVTSLAAILEKLQQGDDMLTPESLTAPVPDSFAVLVKTKRFKTVGDLQGGVEPSEGIQGLVINRIESLDGEEKDLLRQSFPTVDLDKVLILEENRKPGGPLKSFGMMGGGALLVLTGIGIPVIGRMRKSA